MLHEYLHCSSANLREFTKDTRMLASLNNQEKGSHLLDAARALTNAFSSFLNAAQPGSEEVLIQALVL